jgi:hypothetical protein
MKFLFSILLLLGSAFSAFAFPNGNTTTLPNGNVSALGDVNIAAGTNYDWDTFHYHGYSTAEVWIGRAAVNVGDLTGSTTTCTTASTRTVIRRGNSAISRAAGTS